MHVPEVERQENGLEEGVVGLLKGLLGGQEEHLEVEEEVNNLPLLLNPTRCVSDHKQMAGAKSGDIFLMYNFFLKMREGAANLNDMREYLIHLRGLQSIS